MIAERRDRSRRLLLPVAEAAGEGGGHVVVGDDLAPLLDRIETRAVGAIDRICAGAFPPAGEDRAHLALLFGLQILLGRGHRERAAQVAEALGEVIGGSLPEAEDEPEGSAAEGAVDEGEPVRRALAAVPDFGRFLSARTWQLVRFPGRLLLTSDSPALLWTRPGSPVAHRWGLGGADEVRIPLDPRHALIIARHGPAGEVVRDLGDRHARALNRTVAESAAWMYYHPESDPLGGVELTSA